VLDSARDDARLVFSCGWLGRLIRAVDVNDQVEACQRIFASEGLPVWARHVGDPLLESNRTRRTDFAMFMVDALTVAGFIAFFLTAGARSAIDRKHPLA